MEIVSRSSISIRAAAALDVDGAWNVASQVKSMDEEDEKLVDSAI